MNNKFLIPILLFLAIFSCSKDNNHFLKDNIYITKIDTTKVLTENEKHNKPNIYGFKTPDGFQEKDINIYFDSKSGSPVSFNLFNDNYNLLRKELGEVDIYQIEKSNMYRASYNGFVVTFQKNAPIIMNVTIRKSNFSITNGIKIGSSRKDVYKLLPDGFSKYNKPHETNVNISDPSFYYYLEFGWDVLPASFGRGIKIHFNDKEEVDEIFLGNVGFYNGEE